MIIGMAPSVQSEILGRLKTSNFPFELTGSHYFGCPNANSDYDFFAKYTSETSEWLQEIGFDLTWSYKDVAIREVLVHTEGNIHVQLVIPEMMTAKRIVQEVFKTSGHVRPTRPEWNLALLIAQKAFLCKGYSVD